MATVSTYLNFKNQTEQAFNFYREVFGGNFEGEISRFGDMPPQDGVPPIADEIKNLVMHVELKIFGNHSLMGTDAPEEMGFQIKQGNNLYINLSLDTRKETERLFYALSQGGKVEQDLQDMFWGDYYGTCVDKFGVRWMFNCQEKK